MLSDITLPPGATPSQDELENAATALATNPNRIQALDVLRGIALLCALFISVWWFGGFTSNRQNQLLLHPKGLNYRLFATVALLFEGKMRAIIALVFGAGMVLYLSKPKQPNQLAPAERFLRRQLWLGAFGLVNALLFLSTGDLLFHLAIMGILLFSFIRMSAKALLLTALSVTLIFCGKNYWRYADDKAIYKKYLEVDALEKKWKNDSLNKKSKGIGNSKTDSAKQKQTINNNIDISTKETKQKTAKDSSVKAVNKDTLTKEQKDDKQAWEGITKRMKYDSKKDVEENKEMRAVSFGKLYDHLLPDIQWREAAWTYQVGIWDLASMILLGMALCKYGFFTVGFSRKKYLVFALLGITAGLLLGGYRLYFNNATLLDYGKYINRHFLPYHQFFPFERLLLAVGYSSLLMLLLHVKIFSVLWKATAAVGRLALSNYLLQSIILSLFFTGYGMGYFGKLSQWELYFLVLEVWLVQIVASVLWLRVYKLGPAEWLLRKLMHWGQAKKVEPSVENQQAFSL